MFEALVNQFATMSLGEEVYTICFTAFLVGGALCCFKRHDKPARPTAKTDADPEERQPRSAK